MTYVDDANLLAVMARELANSLATDGTQAENLALRAQVTQLETVASEAAIQLAAIVDSLHALSVPPTPAPPPAPAPLPSTNNFPRTYPNLAEPTSQWSLSGGAVITPDGLINLPGPSGAAGTNPQTVSPWVAVEDGQEYSLSFSMKTATDHKALFAATRVRYADGREDNEGGGSLAMTSRVGEWQEVTWFFKARADTVAICFLIDLFVEGPGSGDAYIQAPFIGTGRSFLRPAAPKVPFEGGSQFTIDAKGNWYRNNMPFFFKGMYCDPARPNWNIIGQSGWNVNMWADSVEHVQRAANAGMYSMIQMSTYTDDPGQWGTLADWTRLRSLVADIKTAGLWGWVAGANLDNENAFERLANCWDSYLLWQEIGAGTPYMTLSGNYNTGRAFPGDVTGTYVEFSDGTTGQVGGAAGAAGGLTVLENLQGNTIPVSLAQINYGISDSAFLSTMTARIDEGATGIGFFADGTHAPAIELQPWWNRSLQYLTLAEEHWAASL